MRVILLAALALSLSLTAVALPAQAVGGCLPLAIPTHACANVDPCRGEHVRGACASARVDRASVFGACVQREGSGPSCFVDAGGREHRVGAHAGCDRDPGAGCNAGVGADGRPVAGAGARVMREGACAGGHLGPLGGGHCVRLP